MGSAPPFDSLASALAMAQLSFNQIRNLLYLPLPLAPLLEVSVVM